MIEIADIAGKIIYSSPLGLQTKYLLDLSLHPKGVYYLKATTDLGTITKK